MEHTRSNNKKIVNTCISQASMEDSARQSTQSAALIEFNDDLLTEILLRLPVTSILRFKSVSKHWRFLLSDRNFTQRYDTTSKSPGLIARHSYVPFDVENPSTPPFGNLNSYFDSFTGVRVLQSCNGLLLCCTNQGPIGCTTYDKYYVFNPTTKQLALLPSVLGGLKACRTICFMGLAFHKTDCVHYKVVCIRRVARKVDSYQVQIYSSDTSKWKVSIKSFDASICVFQQGVYWNAAVYWAPYYNSDYLYFKIDDERLETLPLPVELMSPKIFTMYLGESRGHLHLVAYMSLENNGSPLNVYEMLSDHSGWFVKYQVHLDTLHGAFPEMIVSYGYNFRVIDVVRGEKEEDAFIVLVTRERMLSYNVHDKSYKQISDFTKPSYECSSDFHRFTETLFCF